MCLLVTSPGHPPPPIPRDALCTHHVVAVKMGHRKCSTCGTYAWASDDWLNTMVFNCDNNYVVEISLTYECLEAFIRGTTIQSVFVSNFAPLT